MQCKCNYFASNMRSYAYHVWWRMVAGCWCASNRIISIFSYYKCLSKNKTFPSHIKFLHSLMCLRFLPAPHIVIHWIKCLNLWMFVHFSLPLIMMDNSNNGKICHWLELNGIKNIFKNLLYCQAPSTTPSPSPSLRSLHLTLLVSPFKEYRKKRNSFRYIVTRSMWIFHRSLE